MLIAAQALFEQDIGSDTQAVSRNIGTVLEFFTRLSSPFLKLSLALPLPSSLRFKQSRARPGCEVIYRMIERRRDNAAAGEDLLSLLMQAKDDETNVQMTAKQLRDEVLTLLIAGHETTANVLAWIFYLLAQRPDADCATDARRGEGGSRRAHGLRARRTWTDWRVYAQRDAGGLAPVLRRAGSSGGPRAAGRQCQPGRFTIPCPRARW